MKGTFYIFMGGQMLAGSFFVVDQTASDGWATQRGAVLLARMIAPLRYFQPLAN